MIRLIFSVFLMGTSAARGADGPSLIERLTQEYPASENSPVLSDFQVEPRVPELKYAPCAQCHGQDGKWNSQKPRRAHWQIELDHAAKETMDCATCHGGSEGYQIKTLQGRQVEFNDSYVVCAQCHNKAFSDWKMGAHGKRLSGWDQPRIVRNCAGCHNPHQPQLEQRRPAVNVRIPFRKLGEGR